MKAVTHKNATLLTCGLVAMTALSGAGLASVSVVAEGDAVIDDVALSVPTSCSMEGVNTSHSAEVPNGTYRDGIGTTTFTIYCNDAEGFSIYAVGYTDNEHGKNTLVGESSGQTIQTGTATFGPESDWAMMLATNASATYPITLLNGYEGYSNVPSSSIKVATRTASTGSTAVADDATLTSTYAAYINSAQAADTYKGKVKYTLVHPASEEPLSPQTTDPGKICYYANNSKAVGTMGCQNVASSIDLLASNFSLDGYGFAGWSDQYDYATNQNANFYGPQETITINTADYTGDNNGLSLYAVWVKSKGDLQNWTGCSSLTKADAATNIFSESITALSDQRDNNTYAVAKLADGNCWMIENLRLENTAEHNTDGTLAQGYGKYSGTGTGYGNFSGLADPESTGFSSTYSANSLYSNDGSNGTINIGTSNSPAYRIPRYNNWNNQATAANRPDKPTTNSATNSTTSAGMYSYGNYYTWHAAIADTTYYSSGDHGTTSICPTGWRLPIGNQSTANKSFGALSVALGGPEGGATADSSSSPTGTVMSGIFRSYPNNFLYSGIFGASSAYSRGDYGYYWSSTAYFNSNSYSLDLSSSYVRPGTSNDNKYYGSSIRCLAGS